MWPFKKKKKIEALPTKEYTHVPSELINLTLESYEVKIYNEAGDIIGETAFAESISYLGFNGWSCHDKELPRHAEIDKNEHYRFTHFLNNQLLVFEDYEGNQVSLATDVIKKITINVFDEWEESVQLYKIVEIEK